MMNQPCEQILLSDSELDAIAGAGSGSDNLTRGDGRNSVADPDEPDVDIGGGHYIVIEEGA